MSCEGCKKFTILLNIFEHFLWTVLLNGEFNYLHFDCRDFLHVLGTMASSFLGMCGWKVYNFIPSYCFTPKLLAVKYFQSIQQGCYWRTENWPSTHHHILPVMFIKKNSAAEYTLLFFLYSSPFFFEEIINLSIFTILASSGLNTFLTMSQWTCLKCNI